MRSTVLSLSIVFPLGFLAGACAPSITVLPEYAWLSVKGDVGVSSAIVTARNSLEDDLGLDETEGAPGARVDLEAGPAHFTLSGLVVGFEGDGTLNAELSEGGVILPAGTDVHSELGLGLGSGLVTFDLIPTSLVELGLGLGVTVLDLDVEVRDSTTGETIDTAQLVPLPVLAARLGVSLHRFDAEALASGLRFDIDEVDASFLDLDLQGRVRLFGAARLKCVLALGYRHLDLDVQYEDDEDVDADLEIAGPYVGLGLSF